MFTDHYPNSYAVDAFILPQLARIDGGAVGRPWFGEFFE
jgi:hypothetical protein